MPIWDSVAEYVLKCSARCAAAKFVDKTYFFGLGNGNSGKGMWMDGIRAAFPGYVGTIVNNNLLQTHAPPGDQAKLRSWMIAIRHARFNFTSEMKIDSSTRLDSNILKELSNGGETLVARQNNRDETEFILHGMCWSFANDIPRIQNIECDDALHNRLVFVPMKFRYLVGDKYEQHKHEPNVRKGDDSLKDWIRRPEVAAAFAYMVCMAFEDSRPVPPDDVNRETLEWIPEASAKENPLNDWLELGSAGDFISNEDLHAKAQEEGVTISSRRLGKDIRACFGIESIVKMIGRRTYRGYCLKFRLGEGILVKGVGMRSTASKSEDDLAKLIEYRFSVKLIRNIRPSWLQVPNRRSNLELDMFLPEKNLAIEYDGPQHYEYPNPFHVSRAEFEHQQSLDRLKEELCEKRGVKLVRVRYDVEDPIAFIEPYFTADPLKNVDATS